MSDTATVESLVEDLRALGLRDGDVVMVHASLRRLGPVVGGAAGLIAALDMALGGRGTSMMVLGSDERVSPFHPLTSPPSPDVGTLAEVFRTSAGTLVSDNPEGRFAARGGRAAELLSDQPWDDYFGPGSPLEKLAAWGGRVLRLGADDETVTLMHLAEYLVSLPCEKRRVTRTREILLDDGRIVTRTVSCLDDENGIVEWPGEDYFALAMRAYRQAGRVKSGRVGRCEAELLEAPDVLVFATGWFGENLRIE
jgi:aminoglycoside N3'-acetyltransferase